MPRKPATTETLEQANINIPIDFLPRRLKVVRRLGPPFKACHRARKLKLDPGRAGIVVIVQAAQNRTFRSAENVAEQLYKRVDHVTPWRYFHRVSLDWIKQAVSLLYNMSLSATSWTLGLLVIASAEATLFNRHDAPVAERLWL